MRGFTRKVAYLEKPDANLMCAQCHVEYICNPGVDAKTGKPIGMDNRLTNHFPFVNATRSKPITKRSATAISSTA